MGKGRWKAYITSEEDGSFLRAINTRRETGSRRQQRDRLDHIESKVLRAEQREATREVREMSGRLTADFG